jgi:hypothetical protein
METKIGPPQSVRLSEWLASTACIANRPDLSPLDSLVANCANDLLGGVPAKKRRAVALRTRSALADRARVAQQPVLSWDFGAALRQGRGADDGQPCAVNLDHLGALRRC